MNGKRMLLGPSLGAVSAVLLLQACNATVSDGDDNDGGGDVGSNAVAQYPSEIPGGWGNAAEDALVVSITSASLSCSASGPPWNSTDPGELECTDEHTWWVRFVIPKEKQVPGVYTLQELDGFMEEVLPDGPNACGFGGGTFWDGTVEIVSVASDSLTLTLDGTLILTDDSADGTYVVPRCTPGDVQPPTNAVARDFDPSDGTGGSDPGETTSVTVGTSGGGPAGPRLELSIGSLVQACSAPTPDCQNAGWSVRIQLPPEYQAVGTYPLGTPDFNAFFTSTVPGNTPDECSGGGGSYYDGTIQVVSIDDQSVVFTLDGTMDMFDGYGNADGTYTAPRCN